MAEIRAACARLSPEAGSAPAPRGRTRRGGDEIVRSGDLRHRCPQQRVGRMPALTLVTVSSPVGDGSRAKRLNAAAATGSGVAPRHLRLLREEVGKVLAGSASSSGVVCAAASASHASSAPA